MTLKDKRERRVQLLIDRRMLSFLKPVSAGPTQAVRKRDSLEFLFPLAQPPTAAESTDKAS